MRTEQAFDEGATVGPADEGGGGEVEVDLVEPAGTFDDDPIIAEEETA